MKIKIPEGVKTFTELRSNLHYIDFDYGKVKFTEQQFNEWCEDNNIGNKPNNNKEITKSHLCVFSKNINLFDIDFSNHIIYND